MSQEPALKHVMMWTKEGARPITAEEAARIYPDTISASSGLFYCALCHQGVALSQGRKYRPYFKHSRGSDEKICADRTGVYPEITKADAMRNLPVKISFDERKPSSFKIQLGFPALPEEIIEKYSSAKVKIVTEDTVFPDRSIEFLIERFNNCYLTYFDVGSVPSRKYMVYTNISQLKKYFPDEIEGIPEKGVLIDYQTHRMLMRGYEARVNTDYYFLTTEFISSAIKKITVINRWNLRSPWYLYHIKAEKYDEAAARFFIEHGYEFASEKLTVQIAWPPYVEREGVKLYTGEDVFLNVSPFLKHDLKLNVFSVDDHSSIYEFYDSHDNYCRLYHLKCRGRNQIVCLSKTVSLVYTDYLWQEDLDLIPLKPAVSITDSTGAVIHAGKNTELPRKKKVIIETNVDGEAVLKKNGFVLNRITLKAKQQIFMEGVQWNSSLSIFAGLDEVWRGSFVRAESENSEKHDEKKILRILTSFHDEYIPVKHTFGRMVTAFEQYPSVKRWIAREIHKGKMHRGAYRYLMNEYRKAGHK